MTREAIPLVVPDAGTFARALGRALVERHADKAAPPGHVELLNLLARAAGHRSYQGLRAAARMPGAAAALDAAPAAPALTPAARKTLTQFDALGRLARWPHKYSVQRLAMWVLWTQFDGKRVSTEREVNAIIKRWHTWGDHVTLRRETDQPTNCLTPAKSDCPFTARSRPPDDEARWLLARGASGCARAHSLDFVAPAASRCCFPGDQRLMSRDGLRRSVSADASIPAAAAFRTAAIEM